MDQPNPLKVAIGIIRVLLRHRSPSPYGIATVDHGDLEPVLKALADGGLIAAHGETVALDQYLSRLQDIDPDALTAPESLAFWLNLYNAGAIRLALEAERRGEASVLGIPGAFSTPEFAVAGEHLSLEAIEHAKLRRFKDPRIHGALVCGSLSCPTLRAEPYRGEGLDSQLDDQMRFFLASGGAVRGDSEGTVRLSRVFLWFGADFVRPHRMPTFIPASKAATLRALTPWLPHDLRSATTVEYQDYDWGLACNVA